MTKNVSSAESRFHPEELLGALDPGQQEVALQVSGPLCVRAGAGTGKTRAITYRIAYANAVNALDPASVLAVTFTTKAAAEMASRLRALGVIGPRTATFHSAALRQLSYFWPRVYGGDMPTVVAHKASLVAAAAGRVGLRPDKTLVRDWAAEIEWTKVSLNNAQTYAEHALRTGRTSPGALEHDQFARLFDAYEQAKVERGGIDFEDILLLTSAMLESREDVALNVRSRYRNFVIDEYQDVSPVQQFLLDQWLGGRKDVCVVGDVAQTIYSFTGASAKYLETFPQRVPGARVVELVRDYRSTPQIVAVANQIVSSAQGIDGRSNQRGLAGSVRLVAQRESGPAVRFAVYGNDQEESQRIAQRVADLKKSGVPLSQMAILYRTNAQSEQFESALSALGIPFHVYGAARYFEREEVKRAVLLLRQTARVLTMSGQAEGELLDQVKGVVASLGWTAQPPTGEGAVRERWSNLDALVQMAGSGDHPDLDSFVEELQERSVAKAAPAIEGVALSTLHAAKGLEWESVFVAGASEGLLPISLATTPEAIEEERRLLYVGVTRAKVHLEISWAAARGPGRPASRRVSRFLAPLWPNDGGPSLRNSEASTRSIRRKEEQEFKSDSDQATLALYESLTQWRRITAKSLGKPAFVVLPNAALRDIATAKPRTLRQLGVLRGIGDVKLSEYGPEILRIVSDSSS